MLILPIVNKNRVLNVEVKLKDAQKIKTAFSYEDAGESEIIVNGKKLSESIYRDSLNTSTVLEFIRNNSIVYRRNYLITTRQENNSSLYDVYEVNQPPKKINEELDNLYSSVILDMKNEIPGIKRGRYLSLEKLGFGQYLTDEKIAKLEKIVKEVPDSARWPQLFEDEGITDLSQTLEFISNFDCTVINDSTILEEKIQDTLKALEILNTRDSRNLRNYYNMALSNRDIYTKISYINKLINNKPLVWITSKSQKKKQLIKLESECKKVA